MACSKKLLAIFSIVFLCLTFTINSFAGYDNRLSPTYLFKANLSNSGEGKVVINDTSDYFVFYEVPSYYGYNYNFSYTHSSDVSSPGFVRLITFDDSPKIGSVGNLLSTHTVNAGETLSFDYNLSVDKKLYLVLSYNGPYIESFVNRLVITTDYIPKGLTDTINILVDEVGFKKLWNIFDVSIPFVLVVVLVGFGFMIVFKMIKGLSKGKGKI